MRWREAAYLSSPTRFDDDSAERRTRCSRSTRPVSLRPSRKSTSLNSPTGLGELGQTNPAPHPLALAIEVLSPSTSSTDRGAKRRIFQAHHVDYWLVEASSTGPSLAERFDYGGGRFDWPTAES